MTAETDQEMFRYLAELSTLAEGRMSPTSRNQLVSRTRAEIESRVNARKATRAADVRQILLGMGRPEALVMAEANKDPLYAARERQRRGGASSGANSYGAASVFSPEVDPAIASLVTPETLANPPFGGFGGSDSDGEALPGPEIPAEPDPFGAGSTDWYYSGEPEEGGEEGGASPGPQIPIESGTSFTPAPGPPPPPPPVPLAPGPMVRRTAQSHTQAMAAVTVLCVGAIVNAIAMSPYTIAIIVIGYLLATTSYSFTAGEKRFALIGVPITAFVFYVFGLFLARGRSTGHTTPMNSSDTWQVAKDGFTAVPTMLGLLAALYLLWRLFKAVAKSG